MPEEYVKTRDSIKARCEDGEHPGKKEDETCSQYAKRIAAAIYAKRHGKPPTHAAEYADLIEKVEGLLGLGHE